MALEFQGRYALVTGANRGIGLEVCRQLAARGMTVFLGARDVAKGAAAAAELAGSGVDVRAEPLDVADDESVRRLAAKLSGELGSLDVLVNNAGINFDLAQHAQDADLADVRRTLETNLFGTWRTVEAFLPLLRQSTMARIVNVSSEAGSFASTGNHLTAMGGALAAYGVSKAALNAYTVKLAADLKDERILVNAVCPGYTATYPGAEGARPVEAGAASVVWAAVLPEDGPTGGFFRDGQPLAW